MTSQALFARLPSAQSVGILEWLYENDRPAYKSCVELLATRRKLRPVFIERKPRTERHAWIAEVLAKPANGDIATEILQSWLLTAQSQMILDFLDMLKIPHDGKGLIETLPPEPPDAEVDRAVEKLLETYPQHAVMIYLNIFTSMNLTEWPHLRGLLTSNPLLCPSPQNP